MDPTTSTAPLATRSKQFTNTMHSSNSNYLAIAVQQFKSFAIHPASNIIRHTTTTQRIIILAMAVPILFLPVIFSLFFVPFLVFVVIVIYILVYGAEKTERDVKDVLKNELGVGTELSKEIEGTARSVYANIYLWFTALGVTALDYLINVNGINILL